MAYLSLCCVVKDENVFIEEWLTYHSLLGVEHFYIYDNESARPLREHPAVIKYMQNGRLTLHPIVGKAVQSAVYEHCLSSYARQNVWIGFLDMDEFLCYVPEGRTTKPESIKSQWLDFRPMLAEFENYGGLALNWRVFTSSGHDRRPKGLVIKNYCQTSTEPDAMNLHVKSFVRPDLVVKVINPHNFEFKEGSFAVNEKHRPLAQSWPFSPVSHDRAWINHYYYKSREDLEHKIARGRADTGEQRGQRELSAFEKQENILTTKESYAENLAPLVEKYAASIPPCMPAPEAEQGLSGYLELAQAIAHGNNSELWADFYAEYKPSRTEKFNRAEAVLCKAVEFYAKEVQLWVMRAYFARHQNKFKQAEQFLSKAVIFGEHPAIYEELFHLALAQDDKSEAEKIIFYLKNLPYKNEPDSAFSNRLSLYAKKLQA